MQQEHSQIEKLLAEKVKLLVGLGIRPTLTHDEYNMLLKNEEVKRMVVEHSIIQKDEIQAF